jgi:hypothetical protein
MARVDQIETAVGENNLFPLPAKLLSNIGSSSQRNKFRFH